ncbi:MAG: ABC transporter ATP-binding protein [Bacteroidetes bacterium RIFOXYA12_FULL_35_11]|nr:MAG: ABC transporter ATP-binding protein [Bacteroidetes bacterium GWF2_35_48]OFY82603.1 MAG: ABC transporter ATP-binding protein [Bacteroidetes bacterium RIFOXYA12_FULL_35_11]OFY92491.1 MAG: ABC transporter ATP-binding protein [Bacteroidetes bacterium RIFOXYC12_FULL_35_7]HBX49475.1 ABC transporter ATP-binding protein [Bacteroidales bacterium]
MNAVLEINNLKKNYGKICAVDDLSLRIEEGNVYGILGPNGSGKTTTLSIIMDIIRADQGSFSWFGQVSSVEIKRKIGALIEVPYFYPYLSAEKNLRIIAEIKNVALSNIDRVLQLTHLSERKHTRFDAYSLGMKQRLALAAAMLGDPQVLVLDEPTNGLDPEGIAEVRQIIKIEAAKGKTVILASHILDEVEKVCTHVAVLKKGKLIASGKVKELLDSGEKIIVSATDSDHLQKILSGARFINNIERNNNDFILVLDAPYTAVDINRFTHENGIVLSKLLTQQKSLESQFLELVKQ